MFDVFFVKFVKVFCFELGLLFCWSVVDDLDDIDFKEEVIELVLSVEKVE